jgi:hypothetical protein
MSTHATQNQERFAPGAFERFHFVSRELDDNGTVSLRYALDDRVEFVERFQLPVSRPVTAEDRARVDGLLSMLHLIAGVSYYKTAVPPLVAVDTTVPGPATAALLEALYSEGLGEFAFVNGLSALPRPVFPRSADVVRVDGPRDSPRRVLVPIGGGKDSIVALEIVRRSGVEAALFSVGDAPPIGRTAAVAGLPHLLARRTLDPGIGALNGAGALNGHVPITAIVACVALLTAALNGFDAVALANERSASSGNVVWDGVDVNHQFSKGLRAERLLRDAVAEAAPELQIFSILRPASELAIARAFSRLERYHTAFTSCNAIFRLDPALRLASWCCDCPKCRFVFLMLAPFSEPESLREIFGRDLLDDDRQFDGFALLTATGGHKPFECVGEEQESLAAIRLVAGRSAWRDHRVVRRLVEEVLPQHDRAEGNLDEVLALSDEHEVPTSLMAEVRAVLGA